MQVCESRLGVAFASGVQDITSLVAREQANGSVQKQHLNLIAELAACLPIWVGSWSSEHSSSSCEFGFAVVLVDAATVSVAATVAVLLLLKARLFLLSLMRSLHALLDQHLFHPFPSKPVWIMEDGKQSTQQINTNKQVQASRRKKKHGQTALPEPSARDDLPEALAAPRKTLPEPLKESTHQLWHKPAHAANGCKWTSHRQRWQRSFKAGDVEVSVVIWHDTQ